MVSKQENERAETGVSPENVHFSDNDTNRGKGAALRTGFAAAKGDIVLIQDGDLEYDPADYRRLIRPILQDEADVVYGSRFQGGQGHLYGWFYRGNWLLTRVSNVVNGLALTDMETCYKVFRREVLDTLAPRLRENRFGIEPEITARLARMREVRLCEVPISYHRAALLPRGRGYAFATVCKPSGAFFDMARGGSCPAGPNPMAKEPEKNVRVLADTTGDLGLAWHGRGLPPVSAPENTKNGS